MTRFLGIYVDPVYGKVEGLERVFDTGVNVGANGVCFSPWLAYPASGEHGTRYPDLHVDGYRRVAARPVWGKVEIYLDYHYSHRPVPALFADSLYQPPDEPARIPSDYQIPHDMIAEGHRRGLEINVEIHPLLPPGVRPEDQIVYVDGRRPEPPQVAIGACPNSPAARDYAVALVRDTLAQYDGVDNLSLDWTEYGAYRLKDAFTCFCPHCEQRARAQGMDWGRMHRDVGRLWEWFHSLTLGELARARRVWHSPSALLALLAKYPGCLDLLAFKARSIVDIYGRLRAVMDESGWADVGLIARGWPPPWNRLSGMDYGELAQVCSAVAPKLFTFDYSALPAWYGREMMEWNPGLPERDVLDTLVDWMNLPDDIVRRTLSDYNIPAPDELHPARMAAYVSRVAEVVDQVAGRTRVYPISHAYLPAPQWREMVALVRDSCADGMWVNMYGYLSDEKLMVLAEEWRD
ncbi:MAG: hypothetical protein MUQ10_07355 [Anaerolineae bacterium]|nr:hypothetical protein [Anaerolineae bacterium]